MTKSYYYIGTVSEKTGLSRKAIRFYEELGLILPPERQNKYRIYSDDHIDQIKLIKQAKELGFKLSELKGLLNYSGVCTDFPWDRAAQLILEKMKQNDELIREIQARNEELVIFLKKVEKKCDQPVDSPL